MKIHGQKSKFQDIREDLQQVMTAWVRKMYSTNNIVTDQEYTEHTAKKFASAWLGYLIWCRSPASANKK